MTRLVEPDWLDELDSWASRCPEEHPTPSARAVIVVAARKMDALAMLRAPSAFAYLRRCCDATTLLHCNNGPQNAPPITTLRRSTRVGSCAAWCFVGVAREPSI